MPTFKHQDEVLNRCIELCKAFQPIAFAASILAYRRPETLSGGHQRQLRAAAKVCARAQPDPAAWNEPAGNTATARAASCSRNREPNFMLNCTPGQFRYLCRRYTLHRMTISCCPNTACHWPCKDTLRLQAPLGVGSGRQRIIDWVGQFKEFVRR